MGGRGERQEVFKWGEIEVELINKMLTETGEFELAVDVDSSRRRGDFLTEELHQSTLSASISSDKCDSTVHVDSQVEVPEIVPSFCDCDQIPGVTTVNKDER